MPGVSKESDIMKLLILTLALLLSACATTPQGKSVEAYQYADIGTTAIALSAIDGASEANPLAIYMLPLKLYAGKYVDSLPCQKAKDAAKLLNGVTGIAIANNVLVMIGVANPLPLGLIIGGLAWYFDNGSECSDNG